MKFIRRYPNRKLYCNGRYITLLDVSNFIKQGTDIVVISTKTGADHTKDTLLECLKISDIAEVTLKTLIYKY